jgi:hypothetical protein
MRFFNFKADFAMPRLAILGLVAFLLSAAPAFASIRVNNWTIDLGGTSGTVTGTIEGIDEMTFGGAPVHVRVYKGAGNVGTTPEPGDRAIVDGLVSVDQFKDADGTYTGVGGNIGVPAGAWEMTAAFRTLIEFTAFSGTALEFVHLGDGTLPDGITPVDTFLKLYIDEYGTNGIGSQSSPLTGSGYQDGDLILTLTDSAGLINSFTPAPAGTNDGSDDATFLKDPFGIHKAGVLFSVDGADDGVASGSDLVTGPVPPGITSIDTDGNFDANAATIPTLWNAQFVGNPFGGTVTGLDFFVREDGSAVLGTVPEPASLAVWGLMGMCAVGLSWLRKRSR